MWRGSGAPLAVTAASRAPPVVRCKRGDRARKRKIRERRRKIRGFWLRWWSGLAGGSATVGWAVGQRRRSGGRRERLIERDREIKVRERKYKEGGGLVAV